LVPFTAKRWTGTRRSSGGTSYYLWSRPSGRCSDFTSSSRFCKRAYVRTTARTTTRLQNRSPVAFPVAPPKPNRVNKMTATRNATSPAKSLRGPTASPNEDLRRPRKFKSAMRVHRAAGHLPACPSAYRPCLTSLTPVPPQNEFLRSAAGSIFRKNFVIAAKTRASSIRSST